jgi:hypothetical protein
MEGLMERRRVWVERMGRLTRGDYRGGVTLAEELAVVKEESLQFLEWVEGWYRDILIFRVTGSNRGICNLDMVKNIEQQAELHSLERIIFLLSQTVRTKARIQRNVNRRMALENFLMKTVTRD